MEALGRFLEENAIDLIVSGPEQPLVDGLHDRLLESGALDGRCFFGPEQAGAQLEGSKDFAKEFMVRNQIPTAAYRSFHASEKQQAKEYLQEEINLLPTRVEFEGFIDDTRQLKQKTELIERRLKSLFKGS